MLKVSDDWAAYQLDNAVVQFGLVVEGLLEQRHNIGSDKKPKWRPKYTLQQVLSDEFTLREQLGYELHDDLSNVTEGGFYEVID